MCVGASQGPVLALADTFHGTPPLVCLILKLAGDVVEANISLLEARLASICVWSHALHMCSSFTSDPGFGTHLLYYYKARALDQGQIKLLSLQPLAQVAEAQRLCVWVLGLLRVYSRHNLGRASVAAARSLTEVTKSPTLRVLRKEGAIAKMV